MILAHTKKMKNSDLVKECNYSKVQVRNEKRNYKYNKTIKIPQIPNSGQK